MFLAKKRDKSNRKTDFFVRQLKFVGQFFSVPKKKTKSGRVNLLRRIPPITAKYFVAISEKII